MIIDEIAFGKDPYLMGVCFLWAEINNDAGIRDRAAFGMCGISARVIVNNEFVPFWPVLLSP